MEDEFNKPLIEHYQHDTDLGLTTAYSRFIEDLEEYYKSQFEALKKENEELQKTAKLEAKLRKSAETRAHKKCEEHYKKENAELKERVNKLQGTIDLLLSFTKTVK